MILDLKTEGWRPMRWDGLSGQSTTHWGRPGGTYVLCGSNRKRLPLYQATTEVIGCSRCREIGENWQGEKEAHDA